jgi:hypothetical protein
MPKFKILMPKFNGWYKLQQNGNLQGLGTENGSLEVSLQNWCHFRFKFSFLYFISLLSKLMVAVE